MMKKLAVAVATASTLSFANMAHAEEYDTFLGKIDSSMTVTLASDYIWRGQSQTNGDGAIQGSLDFAHESGLYVGVWGSNVDETDLGASVEWDYYLGYAGDITDNISYDVSWWAYEYPGAGSAAYEYAGALGIYGFTAGAKYTYHNADNMYYHIGYDFSLPYDIGLGLHYGDSHDKTGEGIDYNDWAVTLGKSALGLDWAVMYSDTDISKDDCGYQSYDSCDSAFTLSVSKSL